MKIPTSYKNLTLRSFIEIKKIELACKNKEHVKAALITHFDGRSVASIPLSEWKLLILRTELLLESYQKIKTSKPKEIIEVKGVQFYGLTDATKLCVNQYTAIKDLCANNQSDVNLNKIAGLIFYRIKDKETPQFNDNDWIDIAELMLDAEVGDIAPTVFFYARVLEILRPLLTPFFLLSQIEIENEIREIMKDPTLSEDLKKVTVGTIR